MYSSRLIWSFIAVAALGLTLVAPVSSGAVVGAQRVPTLTITPASNFVAGQRLTLRGTLARPGRRAILIESHMGRTGDIWRTVPGSGSKTRADGSFVLRTPAPSMRDISYRVRAGKVTTSSQVLSASSQDVSLQVEGMEGTYEKSGVAAGQQFTLVASTTPFLGRVVTFQQRVGSQSWTTLGSASTDANGSARFTVPAQPSGVVVFRARAEDWLSRGDRVGWIASFPYYVDVVSGSRSARKDPVPAPIAVERESGHGEAAIRAKSLRKGPHQVTAHSTYRWGRHLFDYDWEYGESLTSPALQGTKPRGKWLDVSDGTGRVAIYNGAMQLEGGYGAARGSVWALLRRNAQALGRWETRLAPMGGSAPVLVELVPTGSGTRRCVTPSITIARLSPRERTVEVGARGGNGTTWGKTLGFSPVEFHAYAVEVKKKNIHWLVDGRVVGSLRHDAALTGKKWTVRITLQGGEGTTSGSRVLVDWVRGVPLGYGRNVRGGARLTPGVATGC